MTSGLRIADKLLLAALELEESGKGEFSAEDLVVSAWEKFPDAFGLQGYFDDRGNSIYPNSNRVYAEIMGSKPLRKQGLLQKIGNKIYRLTDAGRNRATAAANTSLRESSRKWALGREKADQIKRLFESKAANKIRAGKVEDISFFDACGFWGISSRSGAKDLWSRFASIKAILEEAREALGERKTASAIHGAATFTIDDLQTLENLHRLLQEKFKDELDVINKRNDERKL